MGGEFAAPSLKDGWANDDGFSPAGMGGEFAAPSLKESTGALLLITKTEVWAANLPPPH